MKKIFVALVLIAGFSASAQIKIGANPTTLNLGSLLELESSNKGLKFPEIALTSTAVWGLSGTQVMGMTVYNTNTTGDVTPGLYTNNGTIWVKLGGGLPYQNTFGKVTNVTVGAYTVGANDYAIYTNAATGGVVITFPDLTLLDAGRTVVVFNNNASGNNTLNATILGLQTNTPLRGMEIMWAGTTWVIIGK